MDFFGIEFAVFSRCWLFFVFLLASFFIIKNFITTKYALAYLSSNKNFGKFLKNYSNSTNFLKHIFLIFSLFFLFIALLQPQWGTKDVMVMQKGRDVLFLVDVSRSMLSKDLKPSRFEFVKLKIQNLLKKIDSERVGLILFADSAFVYCPLTKDYFAFKSFLSNVEVETISCGGTSISNALKKAIEHFANFRNRKNRLMVLFSDGEDFSEDLQEFQQAVSKENVTLCSIGCASVEGGPIPIFDKEGNQIGYEKDSSGKLVISKLNEKLLENLTNELHGKYFRISLDDTDLDGIVDFIKQIEKENFDDRNISRLEDRYPYFLALTFIFMLLEWIL